jgi:gluconate 2-dehydrogenase gamma chain
MRRRHFLIVSASSIGGALGQERRRKIPLRFFTEQEALAVAAAAAQIFPSDESGPGANEAGVVVYIDRQLAGPYGRDAYRYRNPPFEPGVPEQGYQGRESPAEIYREGLKHIQDLHLLPPAGQHAVIDGIQSSAFFALLRSHTIEGMFCDPMHGGNADMVGWQLIGFPGPRMSYADEVDRYNGRPFRPKPASLRQVVGRTVKPSEDEN